MPTYVSIFIIATAIAVVIQACILVGLFVTVLKTTRRVESLANEVKTKAIPTFENAQSMMTELRPRLSDIVANVDESARMARAIGPQSSPNRGTRSSFT